MSRARGCASGLANQALPGGGDGSFDGGVVVDRRCERRRSSRRLDGLELGLVSASATARA